MYRRKVVAAFTPLPLERSPRVRLQLHVAVARGLRPSAFAAAAAGAGPRAALKKYILRDLTVTPVECRVWTLEQGS